MATAAPEKDEQATVPVLEESVVVTATKLMTDRLETLLPLRDECNQIEQALAGLTAKPEVEAPEVKERAAKPAPTRKGRRGGRRDEFLAVIKENPGITVSEAAKKLGINPNYLYRLRDDLMSAKEIKAEGKSGFVAA